MQKTLVKIASHLFPNCIVDFAYQQLANPQTLKLRENEVTTLDKARKETYKYKDFDIQTYHWKGKGDKVLLVHGWEGQAGNFADIIEKLIKQDFNIYAFDAPSHGYSSKGKTSLFDFTDIVGLFIKKFEVHQLISHSFGGVATTYALFSNPEFKIENYILLTTPDKFSERIEDVSTQVGITEKVKVKLVNRLEKEFGQDPYQLNVSEFVKHLSVQRALIIHDKMDTVIPIERSKNVYNNWNNCTFLEIEGTGHFRILRTQSVIKTIIDFLKNK